MSRDLVAEVLFSNGAVESQGLGVMRPEGHRALGSRGLGVKVPCLEVTGYMGLGSWGLGVTSPWGLITLLVIYPQFEFISI